VTTFYSDIHKSTKN